MIREAWLLAATEMLRPHFRERADLEVPEVLVSTGWPSARGTASKNKVIGECWSGHGGKPQVFISPLIFDPVEALGVLVHELVHASVAGHGHGAVFSRPAKAMGLEGKMTRTHVGEELKAILLEIAAELGPYGHEELPALAAGEDAPKKQGTRMLKVVAACCGYTVRTTRKWLDEGLPSCPCGNRMEEADSGE